MSTIPDGLRVFLTKVRLPRDVREKIAGDFTKTYWISDLSWEFGFIHGQVSEPTLLRCAEENPRLLIARDQVNEIISQKVLLYISDPECFGYFMRKFPEFEFDREFIKTQVVAGNLGILKLIYEFGIDVRKYFPSLVINDAALHNRIDVIKFIYENIFRPFHEPGCSYFAIDNAATMGYLEIVKYIYEEIFRPRGIPGCTYFAIDNAAKVGNIDLVRYIYEEIWIPRNERGCTNTAIYNAAKIGRLDIVEYLCNVVFQGKPICVKRALRIALTNNHPNIAEFLQGISEL